MRVSVQLAEDVPLQAHRDTIKAANLAAVLRRCGDDLGVSARASVTVRLTDDRELRALNARFLDSDTATDVLAFPAGERDLVGDIAISVERAVHQCADRPADELRLLAVHGLLHCLGHDHAAVSEAAAMTAATRRLLPGQAVPELAWAGE